MQSADGLVTALTSLGFSQYEARIYAGLLTGHGQTAYGLSKVTGVPQPKIYEALRKLVARGAAAVVGSSPRQYAAVPPETLFDQLRTDFSQRLEVAEEEAVRAAAAQGQPAQWPEVMMSVNGREAVLDAAERILRESTDKVYLSAWGSELTELRAAIEAAEDRGVQIITLVFGREPLDLRHGQVFRHATTMNTLYPHHQNRHLALVSDGGQTLWALAIDGDDWTALESDDRRMIGLVRGFIRHDIYVQKVHAQFGPEMETVFGPGLELLADPSTNRVLRDRAEGAPPARSRRSAG